MFYLEVILNCFQDIPDSVRKLIFVKSTPDFVSTFYTFYRFNVEVQKKQAVEMALQKAKDIGDVLSFRFTATPVKETIK